MNKSHSYAVMPCSNYKEGIRAGATVFVDIVYKDLDFKKFFKNENQYLNGYYKFGTGKPLSAYWVGDDLYVKVKKENRYIILNLYDYDNWDWKNSDFLDDYYCNNISGMTVSQCQYTGNEASSGIPVFKISYLIRHH